MEQFDYIVVGAGSAGCVLASRLSADPQCSVLLIEAGGSDASLFITTPAAYSELFETRYDWGYVTEPDPQLLSRRTLMARGKVLGGSSAINAMVYIRGHSEDFNFWQTLGCEGWAYKDVLPYFLKSEHNTRLKDDPAHGTNGELQVSDLRVQNPLSNLFVAAACNAGLPANDDFNNALGDSEQYGAGFFQVTQATGRRCSSAHAFLRPILHRPNLTLWTHTQVNRLIMFGNSVTGIECSRKRLWGRRAQRVYARYETILCAGAINSPAILQHSGIADASQLAQVGIDCVVDLPGVGQALQDHTMTPILLAEKDTHFSYDRLRSLYYKAFVGLQYILTHSGPASSNGAEAGAFDIVNNSSQRPDVQYTFLPAGLIDAGRGAPEQPSMTIAISLLQPKSRGQVKLRSKDVAIAPQITMNYFQEDEDLQVVLAAVERVKAIINAAPLRDSISEASLRYFNTADNAELVHYIKRVTQTQYHPVGTCKMGQTQQAVVDSKLRVHGVNNLRIADAAIMPRIISGNTNATCVMIGERAADFIINA